MQILFMVTTFALGVILIYSLCVNGKKIKDLSEKKDKQFSELNKLYQQKTNNLGDAIFEISRLKQQVKELSSRINGERVCDGYCKHCDHGINNSHMCYSQYTCELSCMCKDFKRKEDTETEA